MDKPNIQTHETPENQGPNHLGTLGKIVSSARTGMNTLMTKLKYGTPPNGLTIEEVQALLAKFKAVKYGMSIYEREERTRENMVTVLIAEGVMSPNDTIQDRFVQKYFLSLL